MKTSKLGAAAGKREIYMQELQQDLKGIVGFVVLHYLDTALTIRCVDCIFSFVPNAVVVIVDNASPNGSGKALQEQYRSNKQCHVLINEENLGFSRGNNVGYTYAKHLNCDFIVVMNNDVFLTDNSFAPQLYRIYRETSFHVYGPDIIVEGKGYHQNPWRERGITKEDVISEIKRYRKCLRCYPLHYFSYLSKGFFRYMKRKFGIRSKMSQNPCRCGKGGIQTNVVLFGAILVFSREYIAHNDVCFDPRLFMYYEEDLLYLKCMRYHYKIVYDDSIHVIHQNGGATKKSFRSRYKWMKIRYQRLIAACEVLFRILEEDESDPIEI